MEISAPLFGSITFAVGETGVLTAVGCVVGVLVDVDGISVGELVLVGELVARATIVLVLVGRGVRVCVGAGVLVGNGVGVAKRVLLGVEVGN